MVINLRDALEKDTSLFLVFSNKEMSKGRPDSENQKGLLRNGSREAGRFHQVKEGMEAVFQAEAPEKTEAEKQKQAWCVKVMEKRGSGKVRKSS